MYVLRAVSILRSMDTEYGVARTPFSIMRSSSERRELMSEKSNRERLEQKSFHVPRGMRQAPSRGTSETLAPKQACDGETTTVPMGARLVLGRSLRTKAHGRGAGGSGPIKPLQGHLLDRSGTGRTGSWMPLIFPPGIVQAKWPHYPLCAATQKHF